MKIVCAANWNKNYLRMRCSMTPNGIYNFIKEIAKIFCEAQLELKFIIEYRCQMTCNGNDGY